MANPEHLARLQLGVAQWNEWRTANPDLEIDLSEADLSHRFLVGAYLSGANLRAANLTGSLLQKARLKRANLQESVLRDANLSGANLFQANLQAAELVDANMEGANLSESVLTRAKLQRANMEAAELNNADLSGARLNRTNLSNANLVGVRIESAMIIDADFAGANLEDIDFSSVKDFSPSNLKGANLCNTILHPDIFKYGELEGANLSGVNLSGMKIGSAKLRKVNLSRANLRKTNLSEAQLQEANLTRADMTDAELVNADLSRAMLCQTEMTGINLRFALLDHANLSQANLTEADLSGAKVHGATLTQANLYRAILYDAKLTSCSLQGARLSCANLQRATLDHSNLTGAHLWETLRAGWSISRVVCERVFWDRDAKIATEYTPREFENLYSDQSCIELFYEGGISTFEINTLPALLHRLATNHPNATLRLRTIEAIGGGAKVVVSLGDVDEATKAAAEADAIQVLHAQLALRTDDVRRLQFEKEFFQSRLDNITNALIGAAAPQIHFHAPVHTAALPSGNSVIELHQTFNDNTALIQLIDKLLTRNKELTVPQASKVEEAKAELQKPEPQKSRITGFYDFLKALPKEAILKGAGKLGEKAAETDWSNLLHQLGEVIHHLR